MAMKLPNIKCDKCQGKGTVKNRSLIGPTLKAERVAKGVSGLSIANRIGLDKSTLHNMELGRVPDRWTPPVIGAYMKATNEIAAEKKAKRAR